MTDVAARRGFAAPPDGKLEDIDDVAVGGDVHLALSLAACVHDAGQFELAEVVAHGCYAVAGRRRQRAHVKVAAGQQPQDLQPDGGRQKAEHRGGVLQLTGREWLRERGSGWIMGH